MCVSSYVRQIHVVYCTHLAEVILKDGGEIKTELLEALVIFLEIIKANKSCWRVRLGSSPCCSDT